MKLKALITTLILGSSVASVAVASPVNSAVIRSHHTMPAPVYRPAPQPAPVYQPVTTYQTTTRYYQPAPAPYYRGSSWVTLGGVNQIVDGEMSFAAHRFAGERFSTLQLKSDAGKSLIYRVQVQFANGRTQTFEVNQYLTASNPTITIDLGSRARGRAIANVTVVGRNARQSAYRVLAG